MRVQIDTGNLESNDMTVKFYGLRNEDRARLVWLMQKLAAGLR